MSVRRFDASQLGSVERTPQGYLRVKAPITRAGIFEYRKPDGSVQRELRKPEEVFKQDSLSSFDLVPFTNEHPRELLTAANTAAFQKGMVSAPTRADSLMEATIVVTDPATISDIESGKRQISCGYSCDVVMEAGEWNGERYDAVQENIVGNHVALVVRGRAGAAVAIHMDSADAAMLPSDSGGNDTAPKENFVKTKKVKLDAVGVEVEVEESTASLIEQNQAKADAALASAKADAEKAAARADSAEADAKKLREDAAQAPAKIRAEIAERVKLEGRVSKLVEKTDGLDDAQVRAAALTKLGVDVTGKGEAYVLARFDMEMERFEKGTEGAGSKTAEIKGDADDELAAAKAKFDADSRNAYKGKV